MGIVYLLHFDSKLHHAQHYLGYASNLEQRVEQHRKGRSGAGLVRAFFERNVPFVVARTWDGNRLLERHFKDRWHSGVKLCPLCNGGRERGTKAEQALRPDTAGTFLTLKGLGL